MRKVYIILFTLLLVIQQINAQDSKKLESFRVKVLPGNSLYFDKADVTENGQLSLSALNKFIVLTDEEKKAIMANITKTWGNALVLVNYGSGKELWSWNPETGNARLLDEWDLNSPRLANALQVKPQRPVNHPWFIYFGGQLGGNNQKNITLALNTQVGFYLLLNRWDFAATLYAGRSGSVEATTSTGFANVGLMSRLHFPIKKLGISPNIGGEITLASLDKTQSTSKSLLLGISWFVGIGSIDIGVRLGNGVSTVGGLTISPGIKKKNR
jgi:hypothetical protein